MRERLKHLTTGVAIYGAGDVAIQLVNFALLAVYVKGGFLTNVDFGALALVGALEGFAKVVSRWGLDGAFMRYYHDRAERTDELARLASTILWFVLGANTVVLGLAYAAAGRFGRVLFDDPQYVTALRLMLVNTWLIAVTFLPFHSMRMRRLATTYTTFTFARSVGTLVLRIVLVIGLGLGLTGIYVADLIVTGVLLPLMWPWFRPLVRLMFSGTDLRVSLRFGLPRVPHGLAQQVIDGGNKLLLNNYITQAQLGVYQNSVALGTGIKFFTGAFETAWAPFYYATARDPDGRDTLRKVTTYATAALVLLVAGTTAVSRDIILIMLTPEYLSAASLLPLIAVGMACQGLYLLTSIGLNLTSRTEFYAVATFAAAATVLGGGVWLMPRYGALGAAMAFLGASAVQAGVAFALAQRLYPMTYEVGRLARVLAAGIVSTLVAWSIPVLPPVWGLLARGGTTIVVYSGLLAVTGFLRASERAFLSEVWNRRRRAPSNAGEVRRP